MHRAPFVNILLPIWVFGMCVFLFPTLSLGAGFAKQSLFLSQATVTEGQTVYVYAVVDNDNPEAFTGTLHVSDETGPIGNVPVTLQSGKAGTVSVVWKPLAGTHTVTAALTSSAGDTVESQDAVFVVNPKPLPAVPSDSPANSNSYTHSHTTSSTSTEPVVESSSPVVRSIARISTPLAIHSQPIFNSIDSLRLDGVTRLEQGTDWSKINISKQSTAPSSFPNTLWLILSTLVLYFCTAFAYLLSNIGIFYPVLVFIFFFILWRIYKLFAR